MKNVPIIKIHIWLSTKLCLRFTICDWLQSQVYQKLNINRYNIQKIRIETVSENDERVKYSSHE